MNLFNFEDDCEALEGSRKEMHHQLRVLLAQKGTLEQFTFRRRHDVLLNQIHEIEKRLLDARLDQLSLQRMEGGE